MNELKSILQNIEESKNKIALERDKLLDVYNELEALLDSFDGAIESLEIAKEEIENGIGSLSEQV